MLIAIVVATIVLVIAHGKAAPDHLIRSLLAAVGVMTTGAGVMGMYWVAEHQGDQQQAHSVLVMGVVMFVCSALHALARHRGFIRRARRQFEVDARYGVALRERMDELSH